jgi:hypothetical protein
MATAASAPAPPITERRVVVSMMFLSEQETANAR